MSTRAEEYNPDLRLQEFDAYLKCGRLEEGFLRLRCESCHAEKLVAFSCKKRGPPHTVASRPSPPIRPNIPAAKPVRGSPSASDRIRRNEF